MPLVRFNTARDLMDAFPTAQQDIDVEPSDAPSIQFLRSLLAAGSFNQAIAFCAYLLPRREAVGWACRCVRRLDTQRSAAEEACLRMAEDWVVDPEESHRLAALEIGMRSDPGWPCSWLALAAGWSGGNVLLGIQATAMAPPQQTARAVRAALLTVISRLAPAERNAGLRSCIEDGLRIAAEEK